MSGDENVTIGYWLGKDRISNGRVEDAKLSQRMAEMFGKEFKLFDVSEELEDSFDGIDKKYCDKYGEWVNIFANNIKWKEMFENLDKDIDFINFGAMSQPLREEVGLDVHYKRPYSIEQFVQNECLHLNIAEKLFRSDAGKIAELLCDAVKRNFATSEMDLKDLTYEDYDHLVAELFYAPEGWAYLVANMFCYSFPPLGMKTIHDMAVSMKPEYKKGSRPHIELIHRFCDDLLGVPFFTRHAYAKLDRKTGKIQFSLFSRARRALIPKLSGTWLFEKVAVGMLANIIWPQMKEDKRIFEVCHNRLVHSKTVQKNHIEVNEPKSITEIDVTAYASTVAFILMLDCIGES